MKASIPKSCTMICPVEGYLGNLLDVVISCLVFSRATACVVEFLEQDLSLSNISLASVLAGRFRIHKRSEVLAKARTWTRGYHFTQNVSAGVGQLRTLHLVGPYPVLMDGGHGEGFAPPGISHGDFLRLYATEARRLQLFPRRRIRRSRVLAIHLRLGISIDRKAVPEPRFSEVNLTRLHIVASHLSRRYNTSRTYIAVDDLRASTLQRLTSHALFATQVQARVLKASSHDEYNMALADHNAMSSAKVVLSYAFSSFGWTAAQMGGVPYYVLAGTNADKKLISYIQPSPLMQEAAEEENGIHLPVGVRLATSFQPCELCCASCLCTEAGKRRELRRAAYSEPCKVRFNTNKAQTPQSLHRLNEVACTKVCPTAETRVPDVGPNSVQGLKPQVRRTQLTGGKKRKQQRQPKTVKRKIEF
uniref:Uncharacterized protein n=1 Tax=Calcidiscus leptoporus TaxID=127549 RepID=A0A7S0JL07_9EUKA|mmetsp:Transcript_9913/g.22905  ORF Transcript_9913/g.22905 Transcript_9913/m.22905 type:complete len:418 (+) Transcript_9913:42-1295(+)